MEVLFLKLKIFLMKIGFNLPMVTQTISGIHTDLLCTELYCQ